MHRPLRTLALASLLAMAPALLAQQGLWRYNLPTPTLGTRGFQVADNGDLLLPQARVAANGQVLWHRGYQVADSPLPMQTGHFAQQGSGLVGMGLYNVELAYRLAILYADADGEPTGGLRINDPSALVGLLGPWDQLVPAPDGGVLVVKGGAYRLNADGSLRWALRHAEDQRPRSVTWAADGGFYGVGNGAGILRYGPDGQVVRVLNTLGDTYDGALTVTVKHAPLLHDHKLYLGISATYLDDGVLRTNAGVMVMDTLGAILGHLMNGALLSPPDDNSAGAHVALTVANGRLLAGITLTASVAGTLCYLLDCDLDLGDARWHAVEGDADTFVAAALPHNGTVVLGGAYGGWAMGGRLVPGSDLATCFPERPYTPAPLVLAAFTGFPEPPIPVPVTLEPITISSSSLPLPTVEQPCNLVGLDEHDVPTLRVYPNPATQLLWVEWDRALHPGALLRLHDASGRCVREERPLGTTHRMDLGALPAGMYRLEMTGLPGTRAGTTLHLLR